MGKSPSAGGRSRREKDMNRRRGGWAGTTASLVCVSVVATACTADAPSTPEAAALPQGDDPVDVKPGDFTTNIGNEYWPMEPGTPWAYREAEGGGDALTVVVTVTTETKKIANGITARVVRDTVTKNGKIVEDTVDWYAQDAVGNIWYLGEDTAEFENGTVVSTKGSFEAGVDGALPGIAIPQTRTPAWRTDRNTFRVKPRTTVQSSA
jgi:hypothetical protein